MTRALAAFILICLLVVVAAAQSVWGPMVPYQNGAYGPAGRSGVDYPGGEGPMAPNIPGASSPPPTGCDGTIDLSTGCVQPMLGGL